MKRIVLVAVVSLCGTIAVSRADLRSNGVAERGRLEGTWTHSFKGNRDLVQIKILNQDHFVWSTYERKTREVIATAGGTYTFKDNTYKERVDFGHFAAAGFQETVGKEQTFTVKFDGDKWFVSGTLSNGVEIKEEWRRLRNNPGELAEDEEDEEAK